MVARALNALHKMLNRVQAQAKFRMTTVNTERQDILCVESGNIFHYLERLHDLATVLLLRSLTVSLSIMQCTKCYHFPQTWIKKYGSRVLDVQN